MTGYQQYKEQSVQTMTQSELLILLFDELTKRLLRSEIALKHENFDVFEASVDKSREIIQYLKETLDHNYEISNELKRMYDFFLYELILLKAGRKQEIIEELKVLVKDLRDAFFQASMEV